MPKKQIIKACQIRGCDEYVFIGVKRPHAELCFWHWKERFPDEYMECIKKLTTRDDNVGVERRRSYKKSR